PAVAVKVNHSQPAEQRLHLVLPPLRAVAEDEIQSARRRRNFKPNGASRRMPQEGRLRSGEPRKRIAQRKGKESRRSPKEGPPTDDHRDPFRGVVGKGRRACWPPPRR